MSQMLNEIFEQPDVLEKTIASEIKKITRIGVAIKKRDIDLIILVARGSSDNACHFGRYLLEITCGIPVSLSAPSVHTLYKAKLDLRRALVIGVSQSGEGVDVNEVIEKSKSSGALTLAITNHARSSLSKIANETLLIHAGREKSVAATKTYTGQMLHFYLLAKAISGKKIGVSKIPSLAFSALKLRDEVAEIVERYIFMEQCVVVGRGMNYGNAHELALKLMETCYVVAERFSSADFFHGPLAVVEKRFPVILFAPKGPTQKLNAQLLAKLRELNADSLSITNDKTIQRLSGRSVFLNENIEEILSPIPFVIPAQMFAALLAKQKGLNPDSPRSLSKITSTH